MLRKALSCATLVLAMLGTFLVLPASAALSVAVVSSSQWGPDSGGFVHIVGEVVNNGNEVAYFIEVDADLKSASGQLLDTELTFAYVSKLNPGEKSPFELVFQPPAGYAQYTLTVDPNPSTVPANHNFTVTVTNAFTDQAGYRHLVGTVRNNNTTRSEYVEVIATYYNDAGVAVAADFGFINTPDSALAPGETSSFEIMLSGEEPAYVSYALVADSSTAPTGPAPAPSPTASSAPTTSSSPTPNPSASNAPSPSSAPQPTSSGAPSPAPAPAQAPTLVAPTMATAGILITVSGTAAPGAVVELWGVTAPNGTITRVNTPTVTADGSGNWAKQIRPLRNVNLQARVGSAMSGTRFIAVKTDVIQSVAPLAGCIVQVAGRVFEPKPGRTVYMRAVNSLGRTVSLGTGTVQSDGRFLLRKPYACGQQLDVYTVIEGDAVNRPGATTTQPVTTRR